MGAAFYTQCTTRYYIGVTYIAEKDMQITKHLTRYEREKIEFYLRLKMGVRAIARKLDRDHSVISREIRRNRGSRVRYSAKLATGSRKIDGIGEKEECTAPAHHEKQRFLSVFPSIYVLPRSERE